MKIVVQIVLLVLIVFFGWKLYDSINGPIKFNELKEARYAKVIENLKDIQQSQLAYKEITGNFTGSYDSLIAFLDTAQFAITQRRDTAYADEERNRAFGLTEGFFIESTIIDTLNFVPVKDSLFHNSDRYRTMMNIPIDGVNEKIELRAGHIERNDNMYSVFEARVSKDAVLHDQNPDLVVQEKAVQSVDAVNGPYIQVGSMTEINTSGNWPKIYDSPRD